MIAVEGARVRVHGTVRGQVTVAALGTQGNIFIDSSIVYSKNPRTDSTCTDMLGLVAERDIMITNNANNNHSINIHASILSRTGGFGAQDHSTRGRDGVINLVGGIQQQERRAVGQFDPSTGQITDGFRKNYRYDNRLARGYSPPSYPATGRYIVVGWWEDRDWKTQ